MSKSSNGSVRQETRGRPKSDVTLRIEKDLTSKGLARIGFGDNIGRSEVNARMGLYNAGKRHGLRVSTSRKGKGAVKYMEARVVGKYPSKARG